MDQALDLVGASSVPDAIQDNVMSDEAPSSTTTVSHLASVDDFRAAAARFEKLARCAVPRDVADHVLTDSYVVALGLHRTRPKVNNRWL